jgi:hypothetical protein
MKKVLLSIVASLGILLLIPAASFADNSQTIISGTVTHNGVPVSGANVTVSCDGNVLNDTTNPAGGYVVDYASITLCPDTTTATAIATYGKLSGSDTKPVSQIVVGTLNVAVVPVSLVPELGLITGITATVLSATAFMIVRRRQVSGHQA